MSVQETTRAACMLRRGKLAAKLDTPALIPAGASVGRNYAANVYPFRASSHFLYFVGAPIENAFLLVHGDDATLYVPAPDADDALWSEVLLLGL